MHRLNFLIPSEKSPDKLPLYSGSSLNERLTKVVVTDCIVADLAVIFDVRPRFAGRVFVGGGSTAKRGVHCELVLCGGFFAGEFESVSGLESEQF